MGTKKKSNNFFIILILLGTAFYFRESILNFVNRNKSLKEIPGVAKKNPYLKFVSWEGIAKFTSNDIDYYRVKEESDLKAGDTLRTGNASSVMVSFGTQLQNNFSLGPNSVIEINSVFTNKKGKKTGSDFTLVSGVISSKLNQLEEVEYKIKTGKGTYLAKESVFYLSKMKNGDDILVVKNGIVEKINSDKKVAPIVSKKGFYFFLRDGTHFAVSNPKTTNQILKEFEKGELFEEEALYTIHSRILSRIDKVKIISKIKNRVLKIKAALIKQIKFNSTKIERAPLAMIELKKAFETAQKNAQVDIECLTRQVKCLLKSESVLLKRGQVITTGKKKYNEESIKSLKNYIIEFRERIEKSKTKIEKLKYLVSRQRAWVQEIGKVEKKIHPELGHVDDQSIEKIIELNKAVKDKQLKRSMELARWIAEIEVLE